MSWNTVAKISCQFTFKCPKVWDRLQPTQVDGVRHCPECDRDVHLALTEEAFRRHAREGLCVAVQVLQADGQESFQMGNVENPYDAPPGKDSSLMKPNDTHLSPGRSHLRHLQEMNEIENDLLRAAALLPKEKNPQPRPQSQPK